MAESIFKFGDKFGYESPFGDWLKERKTQEGQINKFDTNTNINTNKELSSPTLFNYGFFDDTINYEKYKISKDINLERINLFVSLKSEHEDMFTMSRDDEDAPFNFRIPDMGLNYMIVRANLYSSISGGKFHVFRPDDTEDLVKMIKERIKLLKMKMSLSHEIKIGNIILDGHGHYESQEARVNIGNDFFCANSFSRPNLSKLKIGLKSLAIFCDVKTKVAIGHCFAGATYPKYIINENNITKGEFSKTERFRGDELIKSLSKYLNGATVYACESMTFMQPGVFQGGSALAAFPKEFAYYGYYNFKPMWERVGLFRKSINGQSSKLCNTVSYNTLGEIAELDYNWNQLPEVQAKIEEILKAIERFKDKKVEKGQKKLRENPEADITKETEFYYYHHMNYMEAWKSWKGSKKSNQCLF